MKATKVALWRPSLAPSVDVPLGARSVGHYVVDREYREEPMVKHFVQIFWGVKGVGVLVIDGVERRLLPGTIALYFPQMEHRIYSEDELWEYRWWTMDGPLAASITAAFGLAKADIYQAGAAPVSLFRKLEEAIRDMTPRGERHASALAYALLTRAAGRRSAPETDTDIRQATDIIHREWNEPELGVESLSRRLKLHRSSFSRRFRSAMGVTPIAYITNLRTQNALSLLKQTGRSVAEIARACGWDDPNYFSRCIRRATGHSPKAFRHL